MNEIKFFNQQFEAFNFNTQFGAAVAGVQSGKTFLGSYWSLKKIYENPNKTGIIVAPTYKILQHATLKKFFEIAPSYQIFYKEQKGEINLPSGATIYLRSADNPLGIEGITADWIWLDEGGMTSLLTWIVLRSRVSLTGGQILITTTPYNIGWLYTDFYKPAIDKSDNQLSFFTWKSIDNPGFSKQFYEAEQMRLSPEEFSRRYKGEFRKMTGLVWDLPESQIIAPIDNLIKKSSVRIIGVDWGFKNPAAIAVWYQYNNNWYLVDEWKQASRTDDEVVQVIQNKFKEHHVFQVYPDPENASACELCKRAGIPIYESNKDVTGGINFIRSLIYQKRLFVYNTCKQFLDETSMYHYEEAKYDDKELKEKPQKFNDHLCDASRYALYSYQPISSEQFKASPIVRPFYYPEKGL